MARYALLRLRLDQPEAEPVTEVNIIPVIDISLVLLVILFVTAPLLSTPSLSVSLPESSERAASDGSIAVTLSRDGRLAVRSAELGWGELDAAVRRELAANPQATVLLRVDKTLPYRTAQKLLAAVKAAGAARVALGTKSK